MLPCVIVALTLALAACAEDSTHDRPASVPYDAGNPIVPVEASLTFDFEETLEEAQACELHGDCGYAPTSCDYRRLQLELEHVTPFNLRFIDRVTLHCPEREPDPSPYLVPRCDAGRCAVFDVRALPENACENAEDCVVRVRACCECAGDVTPAALISLSRNHVADYTALVCEPDATCDACVPAYPQLGIYGDFVLPECLNGRCEAAITYIEFKL